MQRRILFSIVNIVVLLGLFALFFVLPSYAGILFYLILAWFVASFLLMRSAFMGGRVSRPMPAAPGGSAPPSGGAGAPLPSASPPGAPGVDASEIGFCPYCGTHVPPGTLVCPACGKSTRIG